MNYNKVIAIANCFIAFFTFLGVLFALMYYYFQIRGLTIMEVIVIAIIYIDVNLLFLYYLKKIGIL